ncbi:transmembrane protein 254 [Strongylocentrotus purpuratus]|uniref:Transmembrane protein 254 n=1 Tax=Strongylocentrotus purpuratus TaxID=7668 RepID=A0A7M7TH84_STRPU|nr:transmembrane protein 254 [Strongylocentrotus purpuratus]|eukprot:XP_797883.2 PREDICTED: transmembrane protein 254 [Strongylocentrotus purpuratus]
MAPIIGASYFRLPRLIVMLVVIVGLSVLPICLYIPDKIPYDALGPFAKVLTYLAYDIPGVVKIAWYVILVVHAMEAMYAYILAGQIGVEGFARIAWFISTLFFGFTSLNLLKAAREKPSKHRV